MLSLLSLACGLALAAIADAQINLGAAAPFGVVAATAITSTGNTVITGQLGIYPNGVTSITGFPPGVSGEVHGADAAALAAKNDATSAYNAAAALTPTRVLTGMDLGGMTLGAGVYSFASSAGLTGRLTLDGRNNANSVFVFQMGSTLTTATAASVVLVNGAKACNVYWQVGSSATLGTSTSFIGNILASASITVNSGVTVQGGLYALSAAVTMIEDRVTAQNNCAAVGPSSTTRSTTATATSGMLTSKLLGVIDCLGANTRIRSDPDSHDNQHQDSHRNRYREVLAHQGSQISHVTTWRKAVDIVGREGKKSQGGGLGAWTMETE
ncbi:hypothetical protein MMC24_002067 [Lignoscripta atroalba]|nr:hypothetical protein [Lignoscripta atroalba]